MASIASSRCSRNGSACLFLSLVVAQTPTPVPAGVPAPHRVANDELVVIMMASLQRSDLARVMRETWLRAYPHVFIVGDGENASVPMMTLPELEGLGGYWDAQHRHLRAMRFIHDERPELLSKRFFLLTGAYQSSVTAAAVTLAQHALSP